MKILIPITYFGPTGGFRVLSEFANNWIAQGHEVEFLAFRASDRPFFPTNAKLTWYDNNGDLYSDNQIQYKKNIFRLFTVLWGMKSAINKSSSDVVLATLSLSALPIYFAKNKVKNFYYVQAYEPEYFNFKSFNGMILRFLSYVSYNLNLNIIVNSPIYFNYKNLKSNRFVYPGIDFSKFFPSKSQDKSQSEVIVIGTIGRVEPFKGTKYVLESYQELKKQFGKKIKLRIAFGDPHLSSVMSDVEVIRPKNDIELGEFYRSINVLVAPGLLQQGAVHYPVIEAMASKIPVVTTGFFPANEKNAWIVPIKSSNAISNSIIEIIENPNSVSNKVELAYNEISVFDWKTNSNKMIEYFQSL